MKTVFLLLGIGFISLKGFANPVKGDEKPGGMDAILETVWNGNRNPDHLKMEWINRLEDKTSWRERRNAVKEWQRVARSDPQEVRSRLQLMLSDKSQKVREAVVTAFREMADEFPNFKQRIIQILAEQNTKDTESVFLKKMKTAEEIFKSTSFISVPEIRGRNLGVFLELNVSGMDQVITALYDMVEAGLSDKEIRVRQAAVQLLYNVLDKLINGVPQIYHNPQEIIAAAQVSEAVLKGLRIAIKGFVDKNPRVQSVATALLNKTFQEKTFYSSQVSQVVAELAKEGFSSSNIEIKESTIGLLMEIAKAYPSVVSQIDSLFEKKQARESSHRMRVAVKKARKQLKNRTQNPGCQGSWGSEAKMRAAL